MMRARIEKFDHAAMFALTQRRHPALTTFLRVLTYTGEGRAWAIAITVLAPLTYFDLVRFPHREFVLVAMLAPGVAWIFVKAMKLFWRRRRPEQRLANYPALTRAPNDDSFPSGHTASVWAFFVATLPLGVPATPLIGAWAALVSFSRYYLGVHFPSDILVGAFVGVLAGAGFGGITSAYGKVDRYANYAALARAEKEGQDFQIETIDRAAPFLVLAIHGGNIEPGSGEVAKAIAGETWSLYIFRGLRSRASSLHVTSTHFDEPRALALAEKSRTCISIHGYVGDKKNSVCMGGGNAGLRERVEKNLRKTFPDLDIRARCEALAGEDLKNIVNRCSEKGVQLELSRPLRDRLANEPETLTRFAEVVRHSAQGP